MHDETPGGIACKDRTLAYWMDARNFPESNIKPRNIQHASRPRRGLIGTWKMLVAQHINSALTMIGR